MKLCGSKPCVCSIKPLTIATLRHFKGRWDFASPLRTSMRSVTVGGSRLMPSGAKFTMQKRPLTAKRISTTCAHRMHGRSYVASHGVLGLSSLPNSCGGCGMLDGHGRSTANAAFNSLLDICLPKEKVSVDKGSGKQNDARSPLWKGPTTVGCRFPSRLYQYGIAIRTGSRRQGRSQDMP